MLHAVLQRHGTPRTCRRRHGLDGLLAARQVVSGVTARQQGLRDGLCAGSTALIAQLLAGVATRLQLVGAGLHALQSQMAGVVRMAHPARGASYGRAILSDRQGLYPGDTLETGNNSFGLVSRTMQATTAVKPLLEQDGLDARALEIY